MSANVEGNGPDAAALSQELERGEREADPEEVEAADARLEELLDKVADGPAAVPETGEARSLAQAPEPLPQATLVTARPRQLRGRELEVSLAGRAHRAVLATEVMPEVIQAAIENDDRVLLQQVPGEAAEVVGVIQTGIPDELVLKARKVHIEGDEEVLLRSGRGAMRIRQDGDVELVGSRISAMSRGLFRLVGRVLRLN